MAVQVYAGQSNKPSASNTSNSQNQVKVAGQQDAHAIANEAISVQADTVIEGLRQKEIDGDLAKEPEALIRAEAILRESREAIQKNKAASKSLDSKAVEMDGNAPSNIKDAKKRITDPKEIKKRHYDANKYTTDDAINSLYDDSVLQKAKEKKDEIDRTQADVLAPKGSQFCDSSEGSLEFVTDEKGNSFYKCNKSNDALKQAAEQNFNDKKIQYQKSTITRQDLLDIENRKNNVQNTYGSDKEAASFKNYNAKFLSQVPDVGTIKDGNEFFFKTDIEKIDDVLNIIYNGNTKDLNNLKNMKDLQQSTK